MAARRDASSVENGSPASSDPDDDALLRAIARAPDVPLEEEPGDLVGAEVGRFRVTGRIGRGGMGTVYAAEDPLLRRPLALKVLSRVHAGEDERRRRFLREARAASAIAHANVATVFEAGEHEGTVFIAMERVGGETLRAVLRRAPDHRLPIARAVGLARQMAAAIAAAHDVGVIHRDLKPENVMVGPSDVVKVVDFGLCKPSPLPAFEGGRGALSDFRTEAGRIIGTPGYMSPEQADGVAVDERTDVFSIGVVLYEMLTGVRPFRGDTPVKVRLAMGRDRLVPARSLVPEVTPDLSAVIDRCLAREKEQRFARGSEVAAALAGVPEGSGPSGWVARVRRLLGHR